MTLTGQPANRITRCAIYTRKSTDHGLEKEVNSLETQRDVCRAYIRCQAHRDWIELPYKYDDGGYSGATLERPALKRLVADIEAGRIDVVVIYKIDRLSRSLTDFVRLMDVLDRYGASFVSVTQTFDTSDSMGRLVLNILLTFAQFERELMSERVRDKKASMRRKGLWVGGLPPMGFIRKGDRLVIDPERAEWVRHIYRRYLELGSAEKVAKEMRDRGCVTRRFRSKKGQWRGGTPINMNTVLVVLRNPIYTGHIVHRGEWIRSRNEALITRDDWNAVQQLRMTRYPAPRDPIQNLLLGILFDEHGRRMRMQKSGAGRAKPGRHYKSESSGWSRRTEIKRIMVDAERVELLTTSALKSLLVNRAALKDAVLSLGLYSDEIGRFIRKGHLAARRLDLMDRVHLRHLLIALVPRAEVTRDGLRLFISCYELCRFLAWDGVGFFEKSHVQVGPAADRIHELHAPAFLICGHPIFALPIQPCENPDAVPNPWLVELLRQAAELRDLVLANRDKTIPQLAAEKRIGQSYFARLLRINYLAPDIQAAIVDGTQPPTLTRRMMLFSSLPLDWEQQRQLMGFGSRSLVAAGE